MKPVSYVMIAQKAISYIEIQQSGKFCNIIILNKEEGRLPKKFSLFRNCNIFSLYTTKPNKIETKKLNRLCVDHSGKGLAGHRIPTTTGTCKCHKPECIILDTKLIKFTHLTRNS